MPSTITLLNDINRNRFDWRLKLRCGRKWRVPHGDRRGTSVEFVFLDKAGNRIQASAKGKIMEKFDNTIEENELYVIKNVSVQENSGLYPTTSHAFRLYFSDRTYIGRTSDSRFPTTVYQLKPFSEIRDSKHSDKTPLFDVVGRVVGDNSERPRMYTTKSGTRRLELQLEDLRGVRIPCTLWENYALEMHTHIESAGNRPLVVLLQLCRSNEYKGVGVSNTYFATKIELNAEIIEEFIANMSQGQQETSYQISQASTISQKTPREEIESIIDDMTSLADIPTITMDQFVWVIGTISAVKEDNGWCFKSCIKCYRKVTSAGVGFKCEKCGPVSREIRFRLMVEICDGKGSLQLLLWDSCCKELVGQSAEEMLNRLEEDTAKQDNEPTFKGKGIVKQQFPDELHYLMGRELFFQLNVQKKNFESGDNVYVVKQVYEDAELLRRGKKSEAIEDDMEIGETDIAAEEDSVSNEVTSPARTPVKRCAGETSFDYSYDGCGSGSVQHSSNKLRKIIKQEKD